MITAIGFIDSENANVFIDFSGYNPMAVSQWIKENITEKGLVIFMRVIENDNRNTAWDLSLDKRQA